MSGPKITMVGAGGMSFGPAMVNDVCHHAGLAGARLFLHDLDAERLERAFRFATKLNASTGARVVIDRSTDPGEAYDGADFVISSAEFGRFAHWREDYTIPKKHGSRHLMGENGGPGAVFHSLRSITNTLSICADIEKYCPDAFMINLTNPMSRVTLAINRGTKVRNVGMCHEMPMGVGRLARFLGVPRRHISAKASGINHFTFFTEFIDTRTGEDLLPKAREFYSQRRFDYTPSKVRMLKTFDRNLVGGAYVEFRYLPLVSKVARETGLVACSVDSHIGEYLQFAPDASEWMPAAIDFHEPVSLLSEKVAAWASSTKFPLPMHLLGPSGEEVIDIVGAMWTNEPKWIMATNVPNHGYIPNVAVGAIVEVGAWVDASGLRPDTMAPVASPLDEWIATQVALQDMVVDAALSGDRDLALQAVIADPLAPPTQAACRAMFDEMYELQADKLPF